VTAFCDKREYWGLSQCTASFWQEEKPMELSHPVKRILRNYESDNPGTKANLARILLQGRLGGTGRLLFCQSVNG
jgi:hypothetical protein